MNDELSRFISVYSKMITIPLKNDWIKVESAFGGLAIYKKELFKDIFYKGLNDKNEEVCEHVFLHSMRTNNAQLYINPKLINSEYNEHNKHLLFKNKIKRIISNSLKQSFRILIKKRP